MRTCTIDWCERKHKWLWYCAMHFQKYNRNWDPLYCMRLPKWNNISKHPLYKTYSWIKERCYNKKNNCYKNYWWRGIVVCDRWLWVNWFINFISDMWPRPDWCSIDRIDNNGNYEPNNCRWATIHQQQCNTRITNKNVGVWRNKQQNKRYARIDINKKTIFLWYYSIYEDAVTARKKSEIKYKI